MHLEKAGGLQLRIGLGDERVIGVVRRGGRSGVARDGVDRGQPIDFGHLKSLEFRAHHNGSLRVLREAPSGRLA